jgi:hypothetical protein
MYPQNNNLSAPPQPPQQPQQAPQPQYPPVAPTGPAGPNNLPVSKSKPWLIIGVVFIVLSVGLGAFATWSFMGYLEYKGDTDIKVEVAVAEAKKEQADVLEAEFNEREKEPNREFVGPDDYGSVTFQYPKTWSVAVYKDAAKGGVYEAYLNPASVPPAGNAQQFALRVTIDTRDYDKVVSSYESLVKKGDLKTSIVSVGEHNGTRLDGLFNNDIRGSAVVFKIRDKTLTLRTDANTFMDDFNALVKTLSFNQ